MYWKIDQRLPVDGTQNTASPQARPSAPSGESAFARVLSTRMQAATSTDMSGTPLSPAFVRWLATIAHAPAQHAPATTADWLAGTTSAPQPTTQTADTGSHPRPAQVPAPISRLIHQAASRYHLDPALISSVVAQESSFDPQAVSPAGAQGLMQLMPATAHDLNVTKPFDPAQSIDGGSRYLSGLIQRYHGDVKLALAAYNWGMGNLERQPHKLPSETRHYVASIMQRWKAGGPALS